MAKERINIVKLSTYNNKFKTKLLSWFSHLKGRFCYLTFSTPILGSHYDKCLRYNESPAVSLQIIRWNLEIYSKKSCHTERERERIDTLNTNALANSILELQNNLLSLQSYIYDRLRHGLTHA